MIDVKEVLMEFMRTPAPAGYEKEMRGSVMRCSLIMWEIVSGK